MFLWAVVIWIGGLLTAVPYSIYYLLYYAPREQYALLIVFILFWALGYWSIVTPALIAIKATRIVASLKKAKTKDDIQGILEDKETMDTAIRVIASENRIPLFVAKWVFRLVIESAKGESGDKLEL